MVVNVKGVLRGSILSLLITFFLIFIIAVLAYFTDISENIITILAYGAVITGVLAGSAAAALGAPAKKFAHVMIMCLIYTAVLVGVSMAANGGVMFNAHMAAMIGGIFAASFLGLLIGNR